MLETPTSQVGRAAQQGPSTRSVETSAASIVQADGEGSAGDEEKPWWAIAPDSKAYFFWGW